MNLTLVNRSITYPYGVLEYVHVRVDDFLFPADSVILDIPEDSETPLILGRPFLATCRALINMELGELILRFNKEKFVFNVFESIKHHIDNSQCYITDVVEVIGE